MREVRKDVGDGLEPDLYYFGTVICTWRYMAYEGLAGSDKGDSTALICNMELLIGHRYLLAAGILIEVTLNN